MAKSPKISPHDNFFTTNIIFCDICDKYELCLKAALMFFLVLSFFKKTNSDEFNFCIYSSQGRLLIYMFLEFLRKKWISAEEKESWWKLTRKRLLYLICVILGHRDGLVYEELYELYMIWIIWREKNLIALWLGGGWWQEQRDGARKQAATGFFSRNCKLKWQLQIQNKTNANAKICKNTK